MPVVPAVFVKRGNRPVLTSDESATSFRRVVVGRGCDIAAARVVGRSRQLPQFAGVRRSTDLRRQGTSDTFSPRDQRLRFLIFLTLSTGGERESLRQLQLATTKHKTKLVLRGAQPPIERASVGWQWGTGANSRFRSHERVNLWISPLSVMFNVATSHPGNGGRWASPLFVHKFISEKTSVALL